MRPKGHKRICPCCVCANPRKNPRGKAPDIDFLMDKVEEGYYDRPAREVRKLDTAMLKLGQPVRTSMSFAVQAARTYGLTRAERTRIQALAQRVCEGELHRGDISDAAGSRGTSPAMSDAVSMLWNNYRHLAPKA